MIHALLVLALVLFVVWLVFHAAGALIHLLWLLIVAAVVLWLIGFVFRRGNRVGP